MIEKLLKNQQSQNSDNNTHIIVQEIFKLYMSQITSLRKLTFYQYRNVTFTFYPGSKDCLKNLSELYCSSNIYTEFFYQLSQICHNIQSLTIEFEESISNGLADLISVQKNLKYISIILYDYLENIPSLIKKLPNTLTKLNLYGYCQFISLSFITKFTNLQELELSIYCEEDFKDFEKLQYAIFPQLQILKIRLAYPKHELLTKFLEINRRNLKELYLSDVYGYSDNSLNLAIAKFCPNLKTLSTRFKNNESESLKIIIWCGGEYLNDKKALEAFVKYSHKNIYDLRLYHHLFSNVRYKLLHPEELESFL